MDVRYPTETLNEDDDDGTMPDNVATLHDAVIGHRIVGAEKTGSEIVITLDNGKQVVLSNTFDCCAFTELESFLLHPEMVDHVILGVGTTDGYSTWHIFADYGDILELKVGWSCGNPFYYGYGFDIEVKEMKTGEL